MSRPGALARAEQACTDLAASGQPVTFTAVAARAGIGRATLYRDPALRAIIDEHRQQAATQTPSPASPPTSQPCTPRSKPSPPASAATKNNSASSSAPAPRQYPGSKLINRPTDNSRPISRLMLSTTAWQNRSMPP